MAASFVRPAPPSSTGILVDIAADPQPGPCVEIHSRAQFRSTQINTAIASCSCDRAPNEGQLGRCSEAFSICNTFYPLRISLRELRTPENTMMPDLGDTVAASEFIDYYELLEISRNANSETTANTAWSNQAHTALALRDSQERARATMTQLSPPIEPAATLLSAPIELAGDWGHMSPRSADQVVERMRHACLDARPRPGQ